MAANKGDGDQTTDPRMSGLPIEPPEPWSLVLF